VDSVRCALVDFNPLLLPGRREHSAIREVVAVKADAVDLGEAMIALGLLFLHTVLLVAPVPDRVLEVRHPGVKEHAVWECCAGECKEQGAEGVRLALQPRDPLGGAVRVHDLELQKGLPLALLAGPAGPDLFAEPTHRLRLGLGLRSRRLALLGLLGVGNLGLAGECCQKQCSSGCAAVTTIAAECCLRRAWAMHRVCWRQVPHLGAFPA